MVEIRSGLFERVDRVLPRHGTDTESDELGEDPPDPVRVLAAVLKFRQRSVVADRAVLRLDEAFEIERVLHGQILLAARANRWLTRTPVDVMGLSLIHI